MVRLQYLVLPHWSDSGSDGGGGAIGESEAVGFDDELILTIPLNQPFFVF